MFDNNDSERGQVGIGTLIVFIAMVLVAAIAAGVLINTAGFLQTQAEDTGIESTEQVSDRIQVLSSVGNISDTAGDNSIESVDLTVQKAPGASDIVMQDVLIEWLGDASITYTMDDSGSGLGADIGLDTVLQDNSDRVTITLDLADSAFGEGDSADLTITTGSGAQTVHSLSAPDYIDGNDTSAVRL